MVEDCADRLLPVVIEREPAEGAGAALAGTVEGDHVEAGRGDPLPDGEELLDQRVESAVQQHRCRARWPETREPVRGERLASPYGDVVADRAAVAERAASNRSR